MAILNIHQEKAASKAGHQSPTENGHYLTTEPMFDESGDTVTPCDVFTNFQGSAGRDFNLQRWDQSCQSAQSRLKTSLAFISWFLTNETSNTRCRSPLAQANSFSAGTSPNRKVTEYLPLQRTVSRWRGNPCHLKTNHEFGS